MCLLNSVEGRRFVRIFVIKILTHANFLSPSAALKFLRCLREKGHIELNLKICVIINVKCLIILNYFKIYLSIYCNQFNDGFWGKFK